MLESVNGFGTRTVGEKLALVAARWSPTWSPDQRMGWNVLVRKFNPSMSPKEKRRYVKEVTSFLVSHKQQHLAEILN